jgi:hypothetical protein
LAYQFLAFTACLASDLAFLAYLACLVVAEAEVAYHLLFVLVAFLAYHPFVEVHPCACCFQHYGDHLLLSFVDGNLLVFGLFSFTFFLHCC